MSGWFKHPRDLRGSFDPNPLKDAKLLAVYVYLLEVAAWADSDCLKIGQVRISEKKIQDAVQFLSSQDVRTAIERLARLGKIVMEKEYVSKKLGRIATILDYGVLDDSISTHDPKNVNKTLTNPQQLVLESLEKVPVDVNKTPTKRQTNIKKLRIKNKLNTDAELGVAFELAEFWNNTMSTCPSVRIDMFSAKRADKVLKAIKETNLSVEEIKGTISALNFDTWLRDTYKPDFDWLFTNNKEKRVLNLVLRYEKFLSLKQPTKQNREYLT